MIHRTPSNLSKPRPLLPNSVRRFFSCFLKPETICKSIKVALVVGPILISINHIDTVIRGQVDLYCAVKMALTFMVPFCVSGYATATTMMAQSGQNN